MLHDPKKKLNFIDTIFFKNFGDRPDCGRIFSHNRIKRSSHMFHLFFPEDEMPAHWIRSIFGHVRGLLDHGNHEFVGLSVVKENEHKAADVADILIIKMLSFDCFQDMH